MASPNRPSYTSWLLAKPLAWASDTVAMGYRITKGEVSMPGSGFYLKLLSGILVVAGVSFGYYLSPWKLVYNYTASEEIGWYLLKEIPVSSPIDRGELIFLRYQCPEVDSDACPFDDWVHYREGDNLIKRAQGIPGDLVEGTMSGADRVNVIVTEDGTNSVGEILERSKAGAPITQYFWPEGGVQIPEGKLYVGNQVHDRSFDSRYFGLVDRDRVVGIVYKL